MGRKSRLKSVHRAEHAEAMQRASLPTLRGYVLGGVSMAALASVLVLMVFAIRTGSPGSRATGRALPIVIGGYLAAGLVAGWAMWMLRRLPSNRAGWIARGMLVAFCVYGAAGASVALMHQWLGINVLGVESPAAAWRAAVQVALLCAVFAGIPGGLWFRRRSAGDDAAARGSRAVERGTGAGDVPARMRGSDGRISGGEAWRK